MIFYFLERKKILLIFILLIMSYFLIYTLGLLNNPQLLIITISLISVIIIFGILRLIKKKGLLAKMLILTITILFFHPFVNPIIYNFNPNDIDFFKFYLIIHNLSLNLILIYLIELQFNHTSIINKNSRSKYNALGILCFLYTMTIISLQVNSLDFLFVKEYLIEVTYYFFYRLTSTAMIEEIFFRVFLINALYEYFNSKQNTHRKALTYSLLISFVCWAFSHNFGIMSITWYITALIMHILFSLNYIYNKNILLNIFLHAVINVSYYITYGPKIN